MFLGAGEPMESDVPLEEESLEEGGPGVPN